MERKKLLLGVFCMVVSFLFAYGSLHYFAELIQGLNWDGITFYGLIMVFLLYRLGELFKDALGLILGDKTKQGER